MALSWSRGCMRGAQRYFLEGLEDSFWGVSREGVVFVCVGRVARPGEGSFEVVFEFVREVMGCEMIVFREPTKGMKLPLNQYSPAHDVVVPF